MENRKAELKTNHHCLNLCFWEHQEDFEELETNEKSIIRKHWPTIYRDKKTPNDEEPNCTNFRNDTPPDRDFKVGVHHKCPFCDAMCHAIAKGMREFLRSHFYPVFFAWTS